MMNNSIIKRRIFFWTLAVIFWLVSATIIGYAFGYRFSFERGIFVYAGSITLKTTPQEVDIYLNGELVPSPSFSRINNSLHIGGIKPGEYLLEVKASGFQTWSKKITVHSGISTEFWNIILAQNSYEKEGFSTPGIGRFFISPNKNLVAFYTQNNGEFAVNVLKPGNATKASEILQIFSSTEYVFTDDEKENIEWTPKADKLIVPVIKNSIKDYLIIKMEDENVQKLSEITKSEKLSHVRWDPKNKNVLFYMNGNDLYRMDLDSLEEASLLAKNISSYDLSKKALFYFQLPEGIVYKKDFEDIDAIRQVTFSAPEDMEDNSYKIIVYDEDRMVFLNNVHKNLYIYNGGIEDSYFKKILSNAEGSQFSDDGKKLLYWNNNEIFVYFVRKWEVQPVRSENETMPITRLSDQIKNVQWTRDYEHVLFSSDDKIKMIEIDNRDNRNMSDVFESKNPDLIFVDNFTDYRIYFIDKNDDQQTSLYAFYFPEYKTFFETIFPGNSQQTETN